MKFNRSLVYFLIVTVIGAVLTMKIVAKAYDGIYTEDLYESQIIKSK